MTEVLTVEEAVFEVDHLEVVGDSPGGTTRSRYRLTWNNGATPRADEFPDAPPGLYSQVGISLNNIEMKNAYEIRGTWRDENARTWHFEIEDRAAVFIALDCETTLPAAGTAAIEIELQLKDALEAIRFQDLEPDGDDELKLGPTDPQIGPFRARLARAFKIK